MCEGSNQSAVVCRISPGHCSAMPTFLIPHCCSLRSRILTFFNLPGCFQTLRCPLQWTSFITQVLVDSLTPTLGSIWPGNTRFFHIYCVFEQHEKGTHACCSSITIVMIFTQLTISFSVNIIITYLQLSWKTKVFHLSLSLWLFSTSISPLTIFFKFIILSLYNSLSFRRYFGIVISHFQVAIYTARRDEMVDVVQATLFYMNPDAPIPVHSPYSALPYEVKIIFVSIGDWFARGIHDLCMTD